MTDWTKESFEETISRVQERAAQDELFRGLCLRDINTAIREVSGREAPADLKIHVVDPTGYDLCIVLPSLQGQENELSDETLEHVAGGRPVFVYDQRSTAQELAEIEKWKI